LSLTFSHYVIFAAFVSDPTGETNISLSEGTKLEAGAMTTPPATFE